MLDYVLIVPLPRRVISLYNTLKCRVNDLARCFNLPLSESITPAT